MRTRKTTTMLLCLAGILLSGCGGSPSSDVSSKETSQSSSSSEATSHASSFSSSKETSQSSSSSSETASKSASSSSESKTESTSRSDQDSSEGSELDRIDVKAIYNEDAYATDGLESVKISEIRRNFDKVDTQFYSSNVSYENRLESPSHTVSSLDEFSAALDYHAFYMDDETFAVTLSSDYPSANRYAINSAFYNSRLCVGIVGLNYRYEAANKRYVIQMLFNEEAAQYRPKPNTASGRTTIPYAYPTNGGDRDASFEDFPYLKKNSKGTIDVYNSEQLLYALELGYLPNVLENSPAETLMEKAKEILRGIIKNDMGQYDKIAAIYSYLTSKVIYENDSDGWAAYVVEENKYPDYLASSFRSFYAEGGLIDGKCVCHGYAKSFNILANIEGIESIKVSGRYGDDTQGINSADYRAVGATYSNHGYSYVRNESDGKFYIVDPTYSHFATIDDNGKNLGLSRRFAAMISFDRWSLLYSKVNDRFHLREDAGHDYIEFATHVKLGGELTFYVDSLDDLYSYFEDLSRFMENYTDPYYKGENWAYQVNLTVGEIQSNPSLIDSSSGVVWDALGAAGYYYPEVRVYTSHYSSSDSGIVVVFQF